MIAMSDTAVPAQPRVIEGAGGVVFNDGGKVLVIRHRKGEWVFPKGHVEDDERLVETALREVSEEAGVQASCPEPEARWVTRYVNARAEPREITWFLLETDADTPTMREALFPEGAFLPPNEALERLTFDEDRRLLERVLEHRT